MAEPETDPPSQCTKLAAAAIAASKSILITAGAGMGVDSGLPDFRGPEGFWRAYPPMKQLGLRFEDMSCPRWFRDDPTLAWGFFGHRLQLYRQTVPHLGFQILRRWTAGKPCFVFTSNVDGQFQRVGFRAEHIFECHGSIHHLQCLDEDCSGTVWPSDEVSITIDEVSMRATGDLPHCPTCGNLARPNILMFRDSDWIAARSEQQSRQMSAWFETMVEPLVIIEPGAGTAISTVRGLSEKIGIYYMRR